MKNLVLRRLLAGTVVLFCATVAMGQTAGTTSVVTAASYNADKSDPPLPPKLGVGVSAAVPDATAPAAPGSAAACTDSCAQACNSGCDNGSNCGCNNGCGCGCNICDCRHGCFPLFKFDECDPCGCDDEARQIFGRCDWLQQCQTTVTGWVDGGVMANSQHPLGHFNGPVTYPDLDDGQLNQVYLSVERTAARDNCGLFFGGRIDLLYGTDYVFTTAAGLDGTPNGNIPRWGNFSNFDYGLAAPQVYGEVDYDDVKVKLGHFYSILGYENPQATDNFFYTHSYAMQYGEPHTFTGGLASGHVCDDWTWYAGIVDGWNEWGGQGSPTVLGGFATPFFSTGPGQAGGRAEFLGGLTYCCPCWGSVALAVVSGNDSTVNQPGVGPYANRTLLSLVWTRYLSCNWTYVFQYDHGFQDDAATFTGTGTARWYSIDQYLYYKINNQWSAGVRGEWFHDGDGFAVQGQRPGNPLIGSFFGGDFFETSLGLNYKPVANVTVRPELRYDSFSPTSAAVGSQFPFNNTTSQHQFLFGVDAIVQF